MNAHSPLSQDKETQPVAHSEAAEGNEPQYQDVATGEITETGHPMVRAAIVKILGKRLIEARELCGWSQTEAAKLFDIPVAKLREHEYPDERCLMSLTVLIRASEIYDVSMDFLFGETEEWEKGTRAHQERDVSKWLFRQWESGRREEMAELVRVNNRLELLGKITAEMVVAAEEMAAAMSRFAELNPEFEDARAGGKLLRCVENQVEKARSARLGYQRLRLKISGEAAEVCHAEG